MQESTRSGSPVRRTNILGGGKTKFDGTMSGGRLIAILGGGEVDFSTAKLPPEGAKVRVIAIFGGYELRVPADWRVNIEAVSLFGGVSDERPAQTGAPSGTLTVTGLALFGGVSIKKP